MDLGFSKFNVKVGLFSIFFLFFIIPRYWFLIGVRSFSYGEDLRDIWGRTQVMRSKVMISLQ